MLLTRSTLYEGDRLFFNPIQRPRPRMIHYNDPINMVIQLRLYRWALSEDFSQLVNKQSLMSDIFSDTGFVTTNRIGRMLRDCIQYPTHQGRKKNGITTFWWKFVHPMDLVYGIESRMQVWLPSFREQVSGGRDTIETAEQMRSELSLIASQSDEDDLTFFMEPAQELDNWWKRP